MIIMHKSLFCMSSCFQSTDNGWECMDVYVTIQAFITCDRGPDISGNRKSNKIWGLISLQACSAPTTRVHVHPSTYLQQADLIWSVWAKPSHCVVAQFFLYGKSLSMWHSHRHSNSQRTAVVVLLDWKPAFKNINIQLFPGKNYHQMVSVMKTSLPTSISLCQSCTDFSTVPWHFKQRSGPLMFTAAQ